MLPRSRGPILIAHRRAPVERVLRSNLQVEGFGVVSAASAGGCLAQLRSAAPAAIIVDAELLRGDSDDSEALLQLLSDGAIPAVLISWDPADHLLARRIGNVPFISRPDDIDRVLGCVHDVVGAVPT